MAKLQLPKNFVATHETSGLPGYPSIDVFAPGGTPVGAPEAGTIRRISGRATTPTVKPGGPYGWSVYLASPSGEYYLTHFESLTVHVGHAVKAGQVIGVVADYSKATGGRTPSHIHEGKNRSLTSTKLPAKPRPVKRVDVTADGVKVNAHQDIHNPKLWQRMEWLVERHKTIVIKRSSG